jgi:hypothetical protein
MGRRSCGESGLHLVGDFGPRASSNGKQEQEQEQEREQEQEQEQERGNRGRGCGRSLLRRRLPRGAA